MRANATVTGINEVSVELEWPWGGVEMMGGSVVHRKVSVVTSRLLSLCLSARHTCLPCLSSARLHRPRAEGLVSPSTGDNPSGLLRMVLAADGRGVRVM
jgi:hypothetical protein